MENTAQAPLTLEDLANLLAHAKATEDLAKQKRIDIEEKVAALIPGPERGSKTVTLEGGVKITVERGFNYKADFQEIDKLVASGAIDFSPVKTKTTRELDATGYEWYRTNDPDNFALIAQHVAATPKKVAVTLKVK